MESWPFDLRPVVDGRPSGLHKTDAHKPIEARNAVDFGSRAALTLKREEAAGRLSWAFAANSHGREKRWIIDPSDVVKVFPDTAPPASHAPTTTVHSSADEAMKFVHAHYPDVGIPTELLESEIAEDRVALNQDPFDVYRGNRLATCISPSTSGVYGYLAFAMGYNMQSLNVSCVSPPVGRQGAYTSVPSAVPIATLETPIQQVVLQTGLNDAAGPLMAVRSISGTSIYNVTAASHQQDGARPCLVENLGVLTVEHTNGRRHADVAIAPSSELNIAVVDDRGSVYRWTTEQLDSIQQPDESLTLDRFHRVAFLPHAEQIIMANGKSIQHLDFRSPTFLAFHDIPTMSHSLITGIEVLNEPEIICVTSTDSVAWLDGRYTGRPLLTWIHHRSRDRSLSTLTNGVRGTDRTVLLWSRSSALVEAYDLDLGRGSIQTVTTPYTLPCSVNHEGRAGLALLAGEAGDSSFLFDMSERGSVRAHTMSATNNQQSGSAFEVRWSGELQELDKEAVNLAEELGPFAERVQTTVDLRGVYEKTIGTQAKASPSEEQIQNVADTLQKLPSILKQQELPVEHMLTTFDLAFLSQEPSIRRRRADFLTGSNLSGIQAPLQWMLNKLEDMDLLQSAAWTASNKKSLQRIHFDASSSSSSSDLQRGYLLIDSMTHEARDPTIAESEAANMLLFDMRTSEMVYSTEVFRPAPRDIRHFDDLESATGALSLKDPEPPPVSFGFLRPRGQQASLSTEGASSNTTVTGTANRPDDTASLGVRLLLNEWVPGSNPEDYDYVDPYGVGSPRERRARPTRAKATPTRGAALRWTPPLGPSADLFQRPPVIAPTQRLQPPAILSTQPVPLLPLRTAADIRSSRLYPTSPIRAGSAFPSQAPRMQLQALGIPASSQELWPSTQQVLGPFGERPEARVAKKKAAKKRMAGF